MTYQPIENYGIIGNMYTVALVGMNGSIDWFCCPDFDSPSVFGAILDDEIGGRYQIIPQDMTGVTQKQFYWPDTNILVTRFLTPDGIAEVIDYMPVADHIDRHQIIRTVNVISGTVNLHMQCRPAFNYARDEHDVIENEHGVAFHAPGIGLGLAATVPLTRDGSGVVADFALSEGESTTFVLRRIAPGSSGGVPFSAADSEQHFNATVTYWRRWLSQCTYTGRWRETVTRSALALKLLTYEPTGAIVAAPTTSLPEGIGGERNWDYRYTWVRDAAFTVYAFMRIGFTEEAGAFMDWLYARTLEPDADDKPLQPLYGINGEHTITEEELDHLEGYKGSRPVRIGNAAYAQFQLDIYGELLDSVYLYNKYGRFINHDLWEQISVLADWVCRNWQLKDLGVWEVRTDPTDFVYSKVMCWVTLDRAMRLADKRSFPANYDMWRKNRDMIFREIMEKGWSDERQAFVQRYDSDALDAANLIMSMVFFVAPDDPRIVKTIEAIAAPHDRGGLAMGSMIYRYNVSDSPDGLEGEEGTFNMCSFWLVEALTRAGEIDRARLIFERMLGYSNHLGLYAEQTGKHGEALGNFPQGFTHLALISAAFNLDRTLDGYRQRG